MLYEVITEKPFLDMLSGRMKRIEVWIEEIPITEVQRGDYMKDKPFKRGFQQWLTDVWNQKDEILV